jgi:hypothetical protein
MDQKDIVLAGYIHLKRTPSLSPKTRQNGLALLIKNANKFHSQMVEELLS